MEKCNWGKTQTIAKWRVAKWLAICTQIIGSWFESGPSPAVLWIVNLMWKKTQIDKKSFPKSYSPPITNNFWNYFLKRWVMLLSDKIIFNGLLDKKIPKILIWGFFPPHNSWIWHVIKFDLFCQKTFPTNIHCVKCVQIRSYLWSVFPCIQSEYRKIRTRNSSVFGHFSHSDYLALLFENIGTKFRWKIKKLGGEQVFSVKIYTEFFR